MRVLLNRLLKMMHMDSKSSLNIYHKSATSSSRKLKLIARHVVLRQLGLFIYCQLTITWIDHGWTSLKNAVFDAEPLLSRAEGSWHAPQCQRPEVTFTIDELGRWIYLEFRPLSRLNTAEQNADFFPPIASARSILTDASMQEESTEITGFVCSDVSEWPNSVARATWLTRCS